MIIALVVIAALAVLLMLPSPQDRLMKRADAERDARMIGDNTPTFK